MIIQGDYEYQIGNCSNLLEASSYQQLVVVANNDGRLLIIHIGKKLIHKKLPYAINSVSLHPILPIIAIAQADGKIHIYDDQGTALKRLDNPNELTGYIAKDCQFDKSGNHLWVALVNNTKSIIICRVSSDNWVFETQTPLEIPFNEYDISLEPTHNVDVMSIWIGSGLEGQQVYWAKSARDIDITPVRELQNTCSPIFSPNGDEFLVMRDEYAILRYHYSDLSLLGICRINSNDVNIAFDYGNQFYIDDKTALVALNNGRTFVMDLATMNMREEIIIKGHEPFLISDDDTQLYTDVLGLYRFGSMIITQHNLNGYSHHFGHYWKEAILVYSLSDFKT